MSAPWHASTVLADGPILNGFRALSEEQQAAMCTRVRAAAAAAATAGTAAGADVRTAVEAGLAALFGELCSSTGADKATTRVG